MAVTAGFILYELLQTFIPGRTFDVYDIIASIVGFGLSLRSYLLLKIKFI